MVTDYRKHCQKAFGVDKWVAKLLSHVCYLALVAPSRECLRGKCQAWSDYWQNLAPFVSGSILPPFPPQSQGWQVSARFKPSWQKQVSTRVSATLAKTGFCHSFWANSLPKLLVYILTCLFVCFRDIENIWNKAVISVLFCSILFDMVQLEFCYSV